MNSLILRPKLLKKDGSVKMTIIDTLYERERLKMQILADEPKIPAFILNSYALWGASQFGTKNAHKVFYGTGTLRDVLGRLLARKSCMAAWRLTKEDGNTLRLIGPMATVLEYSREIAGELQNLYATATPYDALVEFQTEGYVNPITNKDLAAFKSIIIEKQVEQTPTLPPVPIDVMKTIIQGLVDVAAVDRFKTKIIDNVAHPACLGYGGISKGVILGLTYDYDDPILGILTNWHEIGHAIYRQSIPHGKMVSGRALDEAVAFLFEHVIGRSDGFLRLLLNAGLAECGYTMDMLRNRVRLIDRNTKRIETNPLRHILDIDMCDRFERGMINETVEAEDAEIEWGKLIEPHSDILPDDFHYYWDVHQMTGIYGDRASYNPGLIAAFQLAEGNNINVANVNEFVTENISLCDEPRFDKAIEQITGKPLSIDAFMNWADKFYN